MDINNMSVIFYTNLDKNNNKIQNKTIGNNDISIENFDFNNSPNSYKEELSK